MNLTSALLKLDREQLAMPKKKLEMPRLSKLLKEKTVFEIQGINQEKLDEITDMATNIDMKTRDVNIDFTELVSLSIFFIEDSKEVLFTAD